MKVVHPYSSIDTTLRAILNKSRQQHPTPTIRPTGSHHKNYPSLTNQTCRTLLEKQGRAHKWCTPMDPHIWPSKSRTTSSKHTYSSYVRIRDVVLKTCRRRWMIGRSGERGSEISRLASQHDDDMYEKDLVLNNLQWLICHKTKSNKIP